MTGGERCWRPPASCPAQLLCAAHHLSRWLHPQMLRRAPHCWLQEGQRDGKASAFTGRVGCAVSCSCAPGCQWQARARQSCRQ